MGYYGWTAYTKDQIKYNLSMLNRADLSQSLGNLRNWGLIWKENNYFVFKNMNTPYIIYVEFDYLNRSYLNLLLYKDGVDNLITEITERNNVDHLTKLQLVIIEDFLKDLDFYYKTLKSNVKTNLAKKLITTLDVNVTEKQEREVINILNKLHNDDVKKLIEIFS